MFDLTTLQFNGTQQTLELDDLRGVPTDQILEACGRVVQELMGQAQFVNAQFVASLAATLAKTRAPG